MIILMPMGGKGSRFTKAGYTTNKACLPITDRHSGKKLQMVICAMKDIPGIHHPQNKIICIDLPLHKTNGTEQVIRDFFPNTIFINDTVLLDQAYACFLAKEFLQCEEELFVGTCDSGMVYDVKALEAACKNTDALMISHSSITQDPYAHSWAELKNINSKDMTKISIKQPISDDPTQDHATTGMFYFKHAHIFLKHLEAMIKNKDSLDGKYYVDKVLQYYIDDGLKVQYFDVRYICWGTPQDYENYEKTIAYWQAFIQKEGSI